MLFKRLKISENLAFFKVLFYSRKERMQPLRKIASKKLNFKNFLSLKRTRETSAISSRKHAVEQGINISNFSKIFTFFVPLLRYCRQKKPQACQIFRVLHL